LYSVTVIGEREFKILCQRQSDDIYRFARSLLANDADAEDAGAGGPAAPLE
jgi:hypothetical protein